jgi:hypothetical protein
LVAAFSFCKTVNAQNVSYTILKNDPHDVKKLQVYFSPFYADAFLPNITLGFGVGGAYEINRKLDVNVFFNKPYSKTFDYAYHTNVEFVPVHNVDETPLHRTYFFEGGATFKLSDNDKQKDVKVVLSSFSSGGFTHTTYIMVPGTVRKMTKVRGGFSAYNTSVSTDIYKDENFLQAKNENGETMTFTTYDLIKPDGTELITPYDGRLNWGVNMFVPALYFGISRESITKLIIKADDYNRNKSKQTDVSLYADVLFAPVISINDITFRGKTYDVTNGDEHSFRTNNLGFRVGYDYTFLSKFGMGFKTEIGVRPGLKGKGFFLNLVYKLPIFRFIENKNTAAEQSN